MVWVQTPLFGLWLCRTNYNPCTNKGNTTRSRSAQSRLCQEEDFKFRYFLFHSMKQYFSKTLISSLKSRRYFLALLRRAKASARRTWAGVERHTRAAFLARDVGTWGLTKNSKMAAVWNSGVLLPRF